MSRCCRPIRPVCPGRPCCRRCRRWPKPSASCTSATLDDAGWVANRWSELLPIPLPAKQKLMELEDPVIRLSLIDGYLRDKKVVFG